MFICKIIFETTRKIKLFVIWYGEKISVTITQFFLNKEIPRSHIDTPSTLQVLLIGKAYICNQPTNKPLSV